MIKLLKVLSVAVVGFLATCVALKAASIDISYDGSQITLSWQGTNFWLQSSDTLTADSWVNVTNAPVVNGTTNTVPLQPLESAQFFRLIGSPNLPPPTELMLTPEEDQAGGVWMALWWDPVPLAVSYNLYYAADPSLTASNYASLLLGTVVTGITNEFFIVTNLVPGVQYYFLVTAVSTNGESADSLTVSGVSGEFGDVSGTVYALLPEGTNETGEELPGATITMNNVNQPQFSSQTQSDAQGNYAFANLPSGSYQLSWSAPGFVSGSLPDLVVITNEPLDGEDLFLTNDGSLVLFGHVTLADGSVAAQIDTILGIQEDVTVTVHWPGRAGRTATQTALVDTFGNYLMTGVPYQPGLTMTASNGIIGLITNVIVTTNIEEVDFTLPDTPPTITALYATSNGVPVSRVPPGTQLQVTVVAANSGGTTSGLHYSWVPDTDTINFVSSDSPTIGWTVANAPGVQTMYVTVSDGYGGYSTETLNISTDLELIFAGETVDINGNPMAGVNVSVNGLGTTTDTNGAYSIIVTNFATSYALAATLPGFVPWTAVYDDECQDSYCVMVPENPCLSADSTTPIYEQDPAQSVLQIQPNTLVTSAGGSPQQPVCVTLNTVDLCAPSNQLSLNTLAVLGGTNVYLQLLAVADVEAADASGTSLVLSNNTVMQLTLAVDTNCVNEEPGETPSLWWYDPVASVWRPAGTAAPATTPGGLPAYFIQPQNLGLLAVANDPAFVTATLRLGRSLSGPVDIHIFDGKNKIIDKIETVGIIKPPFPIFERELPVSLPGNTPLTFQVLSPNQAPGFYPAQPNPKKKAIILQTMVNNVAAKDFIDLDLAQAVPNLKDALPTAPDIARNTFLSFITPDKVDLNGKPIVPENTAALYYAQLDAIAGSKATFDSWASANGFKFPRGTFAGTSDQPNNDDARTVFFNACDLGFGRSVHMKKTTATTGTNGALVTNYAFCVYYHSSAEDARNSKDLIAIAAIDYVFNKKIGKWVTGFYNFAPDGKRVPVTVQDESGPKVLPYACMQCHRGNEKTLRNLEAGENINGDLEMRLMPLDVASYTFSPKLTNGEPFPPIPMGQAGTLSSRGFAAMNTVMYNVQKPDLSDAARDLLNGWYGGNVAISNLQPFKGDYVPALWMDGKDDGSGNGTKIPAGATAAYSAMAISCRSCHVTRNKAMAFPGYSQFAAFVIPLNKYVYKFPKESTKPMPNAVRPFSIFWGTHAALLQGLPGAVSQPVSLATPLPDGFLKNLPAQNQWPVLK